MDGGFQRSIYFGFYLRKSWNFPMLSVRYRSFKDLFTASDKEEGNYLLPFWVSRQPGAIQNIDSVAMVVSRSTSKFVVVSYSVIPKFLVVQVNIFFSYFSSSKPRKGVIRREGRPRREVGRKNGWFSDDLFVD